MPRESLPIIDTREGSESPTPAVDTAAVRSTLAKIILSARGGFDAFENRTGAFQCVEQAQWHDWRWQQQHALRGSAQLPAFFPNIDERQMRMAQEWERRGFRFAITPYLQSLVAKDEKGNPLPHDPVWRQFFPAFDELLAESTTPRPDEYSPQQENWEIDEEMLTRTAHHKYDNRAILYTTDTCLSYCGYCFRSLQSTADVEKHGGVKSQWQETMDAIKAHPEIEEVILSGGDPLVFDNAYIEKMLADIRAIPTVRAIRIHSRAFTHNPYRFDEGFCRLLKEYAVTEMGVHVAHPNELSKDFQGAIERIRASGARTELLGQTPLLKGVNDNADTLRQLFMDLYVSGAKPYYLFHNMPNTPAAVSQRTSVRRGVELLNSIGRRMSHPAMPEYVMVHRTGKRTIPQEIEGTPEFIYDTNEQGHPVIHFKNWKGNWETYLDGKD